jgi:hypothetical protein
MPVGQGSWRLPPTNNAPEYFVVGDMPTRSRLIGTFDVGYVADNPARVVGLGLEASHEQLLAYLAQVVPPPPALPASERKLLVVWIGIDERNGRAGGSAGSRSFVANYVIGQPESAQLNAARTLMVLAHEQFHQLVDLLRGSLPSFPVWLNESLAAYYGLKAISKVSPGPVVNSIRPDFIDPSRTIKLGLLELDRRHAANDASVYPLFYTQGATFWAEVDNAIRTQSASSADLDGLIPDLLRANPEQGGHLPRAFVAKLRTILGARADELLARYVGD